MIVVFSVANAPHDLPHAAEVDRLISYNTSCMRGAGYQGDDGSIVLRFENFCQSVRRTAIQISSKTSNVPLGFSVSRNLNIAVWSSSCNYNIEYSAEANPR